MRSVKIIAIIFFSLCQLPLFAQYYSTGDDPGSIRWKEIRTTNFQIIFPEDYEEKAQQVANLFEKVYAYGYKTLDHPPRKISVILHTRTVRSNGLVAWAPKRVELYTTPHQKIYAQDWLEELAVHEFRHVVQMDKIQSELPAIFPALLGEQAAAAVVGAYLPFWFIEGDAVMTETALTKTGRGRLPSFLMENKAQAVENGLYSYNKAALGSYKDFVPNRYRFGYWLAGAIREKYGAGIWDDVLGEVAGSPLSLNPVNKVFRRKTGFTKEKLYKNIFADYQSTWESEINSLNISDFTIVSPKSNEYINYLYLSALPDSSVIAVKESRSDILRIVQLKDGTEKVLYTPGPIFGESFSHHGSKLIWSEKRPDPRWTHADHSVIVLYDLKTGIKKECVPANKLFSPALSPDNKSFVAVSVDYSNNYKLVIVDEENGIITNSYSLPENDFFFTPCWDATGRSIYFIGLNEKGKYIGKLSLDSRKITKLTAENYFDIRNPRLQDDKLYFTSAKTGIDNIFCINLKDNRTTQVTSVPFGADYPIVLNNQLYFSNYTSKGYEASKMDLKESVGIPDSEIIPYKYSLAESLAQQEDTILDFSVSDQFNYQAKPYRKMAHLFNFHSWAPAYINVNDYDIKPGVSFMSQNKLGTANTHLGYEYNTTEKSGRYHFDFEYSGLYPIISTSAGYGKRKSDYLFITNTVDQNGTIIERDTTIRNYSWNELEFKLNTRLPLYFSNGKYVQVFQPEVEYSYHEVDHDHTTPAEFYEGYYHSLTYRLFFLNTIRQAELDLQPDWGQVFELIYRNSPSGGTNLGSLKAVQSVLYFPGILRNQGLKIYNAYQQKNTNGNIAFTDVVKFPRGYNRFQNDELYSFSADYAMPLLYPDCSLGRLFYLKRVKTTLFYDYSWLKGTIYNSDGSTDGSYSGDLKSVGVELRGDGHLLRLVTPVSLGIREIYLPDRKEFRSEFLLSISFDSL